MDMQCKICNKKCSDKRYAITRHVNYYHNLTLLEYLKSYYFNISQSQILYNTCGFCDKEAIPIIKNIDHINFIYEISFEDGYSCETQECKNNVSISILGKPYDQKSYERIGSKKEYISKLRKIGIEDAKKMKYSQNANSFHCNLEGYIKKFGEEDGTRKYNERCEKISNNMNLTTSNFIANLEGYIEKFGEEDGTKKYNERCEKIAYTNTIDYYINRFGEENGNIRWKKKNSNNNRISKSSSIVKNFLIKNNFTFEEEYLIDRKIVDFYLPNEKVVIEFYGNYIHCNPKIYEGDFYNKKIKSLASEIWEKDKERISFIKEKINGSIIIIWEDNLVLTEELLKIIKLSQKNKIITYI